MAPIAPDAPPPGSPARPVRSWVLPLSLGAALSVAVWLVLVGRDGPAPVDAPAPPAYLVERGDLELEHGRLDAASDAYLRALEGSDDVRLAARAACGLALVARARGDHAGAAARFDEAARRLPGSEASKLRIERARELAELGRTAEAEEAIEAVLATNPPERTREDAFRALLEAYEGRTPELVAKLEQHVAASPRDAARARFLGDVYATILDLPSKAIEAYERALASDPRNVRLVDRLFRLALEVKDGERALGFGARLASMLEREPRQRLGVLRVLAGLHRAAGRAQEALGILAECEALAASDEKAEFRVEAYRIHKDAGTLPEVLERLEAQERLWDVWLVHTRVTPDPRRALEIARRMLEAEPGAARNLLAVIESAAAAGEPAEVAAAARQLLEGAPDEAAPAVTPYVEALRGLGRADEGVEVLTAVAGGAPGLSPFCFLGIAALRPAEQGDWRRKAAAAAVESSDPHLALAIASLLRQLGDPAGAIATVDVALAWSLPRATSIALRWERIQDLEALLFHEEAAAACRALAEDPDVDPEIRRAAERQLLVLYQKRGRPLRFQGGG